MSLDVTKFKVIDEMGNEINPATLEGQGAILANGVTVISLIQTLNELNTRLSILASMANSGSPGVGLRVVPITSVATAVSGNLTTVTNLTNFGTGVPAKEVSDDMNNLLVTLANITNVKIT